MKQMIIVGMDAQEFLAEIDKIVESKIAAALKKEELPNIGGYNFALKVLGDKYKKGTLYIYVSENKIPHIKKASKVFFKRAELLDWKQSKDREEWMEEWRRKQINNY